MVDENIDNIQTENRDTGVIVICWTGKTKKITDKDIDKYCCANLDKNKRYRLSYNLVRKDVIK